MMLAVTNSLHTCVLGYMYFQHLRTSNQQQLVYCFSGLPTSSTTFPSDALACAAKLVADVGVAQAGDTIHGAHDDYRGEREHNDGCAWPKHASVEASLAQGGVHEHHPHQHEDKELGKV